MEKVIRTMWGWENLNKMRKQLLNERRHILIILAYLLCSLWADFCKPSFSKGKDNSPFPSGEKKILCYCSNSSQFLKPWAHV